MSEQSSLNEPLPPVVPQLVIDDLDSILSPIGGGGRVKYTCLDVSKRYLALGANTGSLYFFERKSTSSLISKNKQQFSNGSGSGSGNGQQAVVPVVKIFTNENLSFTQILSLNDIRDSISMIKINPCNDNLVAIATHKTLYIIEPNISIRREKEKILVKMTDHPKDAEITSIIWSNCGGYLFSGDDIGNVYCCSVVKARKSFFFSGDFIYKCDSKLIQLDIIPTIPTVLNSQQQDVQLSTNTNSNQPGGGTIVNTTPLPAPPPPINSINITILSSTLSKSIVINLQIATATNVGKVLSIIQIGKKLRENTKQGACFHPFYKSSVYTSRPGKRLWLADPIDGKVLSTMNFTQPSSGSGDGIGDAAPTNQPTPVVKPKPLVSSNNPEFQNIIPGKFPMIFSKLLPFGNYLISYDELSLLLIDVNEVEVLEWKLDQNQIHDLVVYHDSIYALHGQNHSVSRIFTSIPLEILPTPQEQEVIDQQNALDQQQQILDCQLQQQHIEQQQQPIQPEPIIETTTLVSSDSSELIHKEEITYVVTDAVVEVAPVQVDSLIVEEADSDIKKEETVPTPTPQVKESMFRVASKENIFSDIPVSSEPLMVSNEPSLSTTRKIIKKKVIKVVPTATTDQSSSSSPPKSQPLIVDIIPTTIPPTTTGEVKRTVIVKKKVIKKSISTSTTTSPPIANPTPSPSPTHETVTTNNNTTTEKKEEIPIVVPTTTTTIPTTNTTNNATTNIQQGIFKTLNSATSSFLEIKQFALNKTNEIKTDITHKILGPETTTTTSNQINNQSTTATTTTNIPTTIPIIESHPIEILEKLTKQTYESLLMYKENKNQESFEPMLQIWVLQFNHTLEDNVIANDMIREIVTSCFEYGWNLKCSKDTTGQLCKCWCERSAIDYIKQYYSFIISNRVYKYINDRQWNQCIETLIELESFTKQESKIISTIYQFIDSNDSATSLSLLESHNNDYGLLFRFLNQLLDLDPIESSKFYAKQYPIILPRNIFQHLENNHSSSSPTGIDQTGQSIKFEYLNNLMKYKPECCKLNSSLLQEWFNCNLLNDKPNLNQLYYDKDEIGNGVGNNGKLIPKLKSNKIEWKSSDVLLQIIENVIHSEYNGNIVYLESICVENGFFSGLIKIYSYYFTSVYSQKSILYNAQQLTYYSKKLLDLTIFTDDKTTFTNLFESNTCIEIWCNTLETMKRLREILVEVHHGDQDDILSTVEISEIFILNLMGKAIGPLETIELVCKYSVMFEKSKIQTSLLSDWIKLGKWSLYDRSKLSYDILTGLDSHLWLKKPLTISPQILSMIGQEIDQSLPLNPFKEFNNDIGNSSSKDIDFKIPQFFEDNSRRHWGVETELSTGSCPICTLPLAENPESSFLGSTPATIIVFPTCGHSYHHCCIEDQGCMICFSKR